jgi:hypothetical protein
MSLEQGIAIAFILFLGSALQSAIGFAFALFVLPFILWLGLPLSHAVILILISALVQLSVGAIKLRNSIRWGSVWFATLIRFATLPLGLLILFQLDAQEPDFIKQIIGLIVLLSVMSIFFGKIDPKEKIHTGWGILAFSMSGFMQGISSVGLPPLVLWVMAHNWSNSETRAFLFASYLLSIPVQIGIMWFTIGDPILAPLSTSLLLAPAVAIGSVVGVRAGDYISKPLLRKISYIVLVLAAIFSILAPWILP